MKKKLVSVLLCGCMAASLLAGCGGGSDSNEAEPAASEDTTEEETSGGGYHFEVLVKSFQSTYWQACKLGIDEAAEELGVTVNTTGPNAESDIADQINMLNSAISSEPDGIALAACDTSAVIDSLQDATAADIIDRGMGFINKFKELAEADGYTVAVIGNEKFVGGVENNGAEDSADIIIEVAVPAQTTVELSATEASNIMNKEDTIAIFGSNQVTAEGILTANNNLDVLATDIIAVGFDAGTTLKAAVKDGTFLGAVTQAPVDQGRIAVETLYDVCEGKEVSDTQTDCYWYDAENMEEDDIAPNLYD